MYCLSILKVMFFIGAIRLAKVCLFLFGLLYSSYTNAQLVDVSGIVKDEKGDLLTGINIMLENDNTVGTLTDINGHFELNISKANMDDRLIIFGIGTETKIIPVERLFTNNTIYLKSKSSSLNEVSLILSKSLLEKFSTKKVSKLEIISNPNSQADALNLVRSLPVSTGNIESPVPVLRGSSAYLNQVYLNGVPLYNVIKGVQLNNSIGSSSVFDSNIIESTTIYASNPPNNYTNTSGGVIDIQTVEEIRAKKQSNISMVGSSFFYSIPIKDKNGISFFGNYTDLRLLKKTNRKSLENTNKYHNLDVGINLFSRIKEDFSLKYFCQFNTEKGSYKTRIYSFQDDFIGKNQKLFNVINFSYTKNKNRYSFNSGISYFEDEIHFGSLSLNKKSDFIYSNLSFKRFVNEKFVFELNLNYENIYNITNGSLPAYYFSYLIDLPTIRIDQKNKLEYMDVSLFLNYKPLKNLNLGLGFNKNVFKNIQNWKDIYQLYGSYGSINDKHRIIFGYGFYRSFIENSFYGGFEDLNSNQLTIEYNFQSSYLTGKIAVYNKIENGDQPIQQLNQTFDKKELNGVEVDIGINVSSDVRLSISNVWLDSYILKDAQRYRSHDHLAYFVKMYLSIFVTKSAYMSVSCISRPGTYYTPVFDAKFIDEINEYEPIFSKKLNSEKYNDYNNITVGFSTSFKLFGLNPLFYCGINNIFNSKNERNVFYDIQYKNPKYEYFSGRLFFAGIALNF